MDKKELVNLRKVIRSMKNKNQTLLISGQDFSCVWNGESFIWYVNGRAYDGCTAKEVISWIDDGKYVKRYSYSYAA